MKKTILTNIQNGITLKDLSLLIGKSERQLGNMLRLLENEGYQINKAISTTGDIKLSLDYSLKKDIAKIEYDKDSVRVGVIADIHIGRENDGAEYLASAIDYFKNNDIHIVFIVGDLLEGMTYFESEKYPDGDTQLDRFFKVFPYTSGINFFYIKGNHDYSILKRSGLDIGKRILNRPDFIDLGFGYGRIRIGESMIGLKHDLLISKPVNYSDDDITIKGHSHRFEFLGNVLVVPAILNSDFYEDGLSSGFLDVTFSMSEDNYIKSMDVRHLVFSEGVRLATNIKAPVKIKKKI